MKSVLIVYGTKTGCTSGIADAIGTEFESIGASVRVVAAEDAPSAAEYDAIVVGSGVRAGNWHGSVKKWVSANAEALKSRPTAFFTACLTLASEPEKTDEVRAYTDALITETGVQPFSVGLFKGLNEPKRFSLPERLILKALKAPEGDFREMDVVSAWARDIAAELGVRS